MSEEKPKSGQEQQPNDAGGFKFAITLLAALGTILYTAYNYIQSNPLDIYSYVFDCILISVALILVFGLLLYILIKGYSIEVDENDGSNRKEQLIKRARAVYLFVFPSIIAILTLVVFDFILVYFKHEHDLGFSFYDPKITISLLFIVGIVVYAVFGNIAQDWVEEYPSKTRWIKIWRSIKIFFSILAVSGVIFLIVFTVVPYSTILQGHFTVDMESSYYKNNSPIPVLIHVAGPNTNLSIQLFQESSNHNLSEIDNINLSSERNTNQVAQGENSTLFGNTLDYGSYNVFIDTSGLSTGYYEVVVKRQKYEKTYGARGFYLLNENAPLNTSHE